MSVKEVRPSDDARGLRFAIVASLWNETIVRKLVDGAIETLQARGVGANDIDVRWVPGAFELPLAARWHTDAAHAVIALGCVIRGETDHFRLVADAASQGLQRVALDAGRPVINGVLAVENVAQAEARSGGSHGNVGSQCALSAIRMANLARGNSAA